MPVRLRRKFPSGYSYESGPAVGTKKGGKQYGLDYQEEGVDRI